MIQNQVEATQGQHLLLMGEIMDAEQTLLSIQRLPPESEQCVTQVQRELCRIGMEGRLRLAQRDQ